MRSERAKREDDAVTAERLGYRPELDGVRALAAIAVVFAHYLAWGPGRFGVEVFFVLSGFLITTILLEDVAESGTVRLGRFYLRRAARLLPCLITVVVVCAALLPLLQPGTGNGLLPALLYYANWQRAAGVEMGSLGHTWSLSIEEQFYLVWPLLVVATRRVPSVAMAKVCLAASLVLLPLPGVPYLLAGAGIAHSRQAGWRLNINLDAVTTALATRPLVWTGKRSYGLYLWHFPIGHVLNDHTPAGLATAVAVTLVVVECSYRWIEMPLRNAVSHHERPGADGRVRRGGGVLRPLQLDGA